MSMLVSFNKFVRRQGRGSVFSYTRLKDEVVLRLIQENFDRAKPGYREGVLLVPVPPEGFVSGVIQLELNQEFEAVYRVRLRGELPQKMMFTRMDRRIPARSVRIVLYSHEALGRDADTDADYEIISINASPVEGEEPVTPEALMAGYYRDPAVTPIDMTPEQFIAALRVARDYWRDKVMVHCLEGRMRYWPRGFRAARP